MHGIAARIELGVSLQDAAVAEDVSPHTARSWLQRGRREQSGIYNDFAAAVERARERSQAAAAPMDREELKIVVAEAARAGSVTAAKLCWEILRAEPGEDADPLAGFDELAARRQRQRKGTA